MQLDFDSQASSNTAAIRHIVAGQGLDGVRIPHKSQHGQAKSGSTAAYAPL